MVFVVGTHVRSLATHYDEGTADKYGVTYSQRLAAKGVCTLSRAFHLVPPLTPPLLLTGDGIWCYGKVNHVYAGARRGGGQSYRVKWDDGTSMKVPEVPWLCWVSCSLAFRAFISFRVFLECARRSRRCNRA